MQGHSGVGAGNSFRIFAITGETPTITANQVPIVVFDGIEKSDYTGHPNLNNLEVTLDNLRNDDVVAKLLADYLEADSATEAVEITLEDGTKESTSSSGADPELYGIGSLLIANGKRMTYMGPIKLSGDSGAVSTTGGAFTRRTFKATFVKATKAITLPDPAVANAADATFYPQTLYTLPQGTVTMPATATHAVGTSAIEAWLPKGTKDK